MPYTEAQQLLDWAFVSGRQHYWKSGFLQELSDAAIETFVDFGRRKPSPHSIALLEHIHGGVQRRAPGDTAFSHRDARYSLLILGTWETRAQADANFRWIREFWAAMRPFMRPGVYVNYMSEGEAEDRVRGAYGANYARLAALKHKYDPTNFFRMNQNVKPEAAGLETLSA
jgi:FAD/FMN-containing dehydrogenase